jgi:hypothetical protein
MFSLGELLKSCSPYRCRDSSLYRHIQTIPQDLILAPAAAWQFLHISQSHTFCILAFFVFLHVFAHFAFLHSRVFCALTRATACLPRIHCIPFTCPVLILQGPLVHISLCFTHITSYMSLHSIYVHLSRYVFILHHPCTFSATYSALSPGNSLSMLTRQCIVGGFYCTSLLSLTH